MVSSAPACSGVTRCRSSESRAERFGVIRRCANRLRDRRWSHPPARGVRCGLLLNEGGGFRDDPIVQRTRAGIDSRTGAAGVRTWHKGEPNRPLRNGKRSLGQRGAPSSRPQRPGAPWHRHSSALEDGGSPLDQAGSAIPSAGPTLAPDGRPCILPRSPAPISLRRRNGREFSAFSSPTMTTFSASTWPRFWRAAGLRDPRSQYRTGGGRLATGGP